MTVPRLAPFFEPRAVAVIGASRNPSKIGGSVLANLRSAGFPGRVIPVNARAETVQGLAAFRSLLTVDGPVDLATDDGKFGFAHPLLSNNGIYNVLFFETVDPELWR